MKFRTLKSTSDLDAADYGVTIFPNPADNTAIVVVEGLTSAADITIVDASGRVVGRYRIVAGENSISLDVSSLVEGNYIVRILSDAIDKVEHLVIKKR